MGCQGERILIVCAPRHGNVTYTHKWYNESDDSQIASPGSADYVCTLPTKPHMMKNVIGIIDDSASFVSYVTMIVSLLSLLLGSVGQSVRLGGNTD